MADVKQAWQDIAAARRAALLASIPPEWLIPLVSLPADRVLDVTKFRESSGLFTELEIQITDMGAVDLIDHILHRIWSTEMVTRAFCKAAATAHQLTNCLTETLFPEALAHAKALDRHLEDTGKPIGPLHGLPISLKDNFNIAAKASSVGFVGWANDLAADNSCLVDLLVRLGAVPYVKTNVPTAMMIAETVNNLFGRTTNPLNRSLTPGGSSGGESALITFGGSPLGIGSDIGGSLRIPAACCGIYTIRPSSGRFPHFDTKSGMAGQEAVPSVNGPLARTLADIAFYTKTIIDSEPWLVDPKCVPVPWRPVELQGKLKIGVLWHDGIVMPTPPVQRALRITVEKLRKAGHEVVEWSPEGHSAALILLGKMFVADGGKSIRNAIDSSGEPWRPEMASYEKASELGVYEMWQIHRERTELAAMYLRRWNACEGLDAILGLDTFSRTAHPFLSSLMDLTRSSSLIRSFVSLGPTTPYASVRHGDFGYVGYTGIWNVLDYTAVSFPTGVRVDKDIDIFPTESKWESLSDFDTEVHQKYEAASVHGMPVSLQLAGRRFQEEKVLAVTERVLEALA